jgi:predicted acylesterase/phospholipase RssA
LSSCRSPFKLFIGATQANTGRPRVFREAEPTVDVLLAWAYLPRIHHPVEIDGQPYWDGGYSANPAVFPMRYDCYTTDVLLGPLARDHTPHSPRTHQGAGLQRPLPAQNATVLPGDVVCRPVVHRLRMA